MAAAGVVALKLVVDLRGRAQLLLQTVGAHQRRGTVHLVEIHDLLRDVEESGVVVQLLLHQLLTEDAAHLLGGQGLAGAGIERGRGLVLHVRAEVVPFGRDLVFGEIDFVGDVLLTHGDRSFFLMSEANKKLLPLQMFCRDKSQNSCGTTRLGAMHPLKRANTRRPYVNGRPTPSPILRLAPVLFALARPFARHRRTAFPPAAALCAFGSPGYSSCSSVWVYFTTAKK